MFRTLSIHNPMRIYAFFAKFGNPPARPDRRSAHIFLIDKHLSEIGINRGARRRIFRIRPLRNRSSKHRRPPGDTSRCGAAPAADERGTRQARNRCIPSPATGRQERSGNRATDSPCGAARYRHKPRPSRRTRPASRSASASLSARNRPARESPRDPVAKDGRFATEESRVAAYAGAKFLHALLAKVQAEQFG